MENWDHHYAFVKFHGDGLRSKDAPEADKRAVRAARAYVEAAAKEGITPSSDAPGARTELYGSGASRGKNSTYRWVFDGTYIYGADSKTVPSERTYWTDNDGRLIGKGKGGPGQTGALAPWTPPPAKTDWDGASEQLFLTGLFGPFVAIFG